MDYHPFVSLEAVVGGRVVDEGSGAVVAAAVEVGAAGSVRDTARGRTQRDLGHRPYRLEHRTLVLYSRNQPRTNIVREKRKDNRGRDSLPSCSI